MPRKSAAEVRENLALDVAEARARLGETRFWLLKQWVKDVNGAYEAAIAPYVNEATCLLDAGCSRGDPDIPSIQRAGFSVGCDVDISGLRGNELVRERVQSPLDVLPFGDHSFDVVICKFVVEHLKTPERTFGEFARILKPGGVAVILTPNALSFFTMISQAIPFRLKALMKKHMFGGYEEDTFPTWYYANRRGRLDQLMHEVGLQTVRLELLAGMWIFFIFNKPLALLIRSCERIQLRMPALRNCSTYLMGVWRKA